MSVSVYQKRKLNISWVPFFFVLAAHLLGFTALFHFSWAGLGICIVLHWVTGGAGITLGYHRLLTHRSFRVPKMLEYFFAVLGALACQGDPITWVATHRKHHAKSDLPGDPHSPVHGFFWAHMGWCVIKSEMDHFHNCEKYAPDLTADPFYRFLHKFYILSSIFLGIGLYAWGGWSFVLWGIFARLVLVYHSTWAVNSAAHVWGYQTYESKDQSMNLWWVALITHGEGWHNNHHAFQTSARHGLKWWEIDTTFWMIKTLEFFRLATAIKIPSARSLKTSAI